MNSTSMEASRRGFIKRGLSASVGIAAFSMPGLLSASVNSEAKKDMAHFKSDTQLGVASYTLRKFSLSEALDMTLRCGLNRITLKSMHLPLDADTETIKAATEECREKGVDFYGAGVIYMKSKDEVDRAFDYAKTAGLEMIIGVPNHELLDYVEQKVKANDIKLAIHNHGPGDDLYPSAESVYTKIKDRDSRMGLCLDIGHTQRIKRDPVQDVNKYIDRIFDIHLKDVTASEADGKTCIIGRGVIDFPAFLKTVSKLQYKGTLALEYEAEENDPLPGMMESIGYVKGILATL